MKLILQGLFRKDAPDNLVSVIYTCASSLAFAPYSVHWNVGSEGDMEVALRLAVSRSRELNFNPRSEPAQQYDRANVNGALWPSIYRCLKRMHFYEKSQSEYWAISSGLLTHEAKRKSTVS